MQTGSAVKPWKWGGGAGNGWYFFNKKGRARKC